MTTLFVPDELEARLLALNAVLMPPSGPAATLEGEMVRAINRVVYRYYNDGDVWYRGYGTETAGPPVAFLTEATPISSDLNRIFVRSDGTHGNTYERLLFEAVEAVVNYVEGRTEYTPNTHDMWKFTAQYQDQQDDDDFDDYYYDGEDD